MIASRLISLRLHNRENTLFILFCLAMTITIFSGCKKQSIAAFDENRAGFTMLDPITSEQTNNLITNRNGKVNMLYSGAGQNTIAAQSDNNGHVRWKKNIPEKFNYPFEPVLCTEMNGGLTFFAGNNRYSITPDGITYAIDSNFIPELDNYLITDVKINSKGNYVFWGNYPRMSPQNGFIVEFDRNGKRIFRSFSPTNFVYNGCELLQDGGYILIGNLMQAPGTGIEYRLLISRFDAKGKLIFHKYINLPDKSDGSTGGRYTSDIAAISENTFATACIAPNSNTYRVFKINSEGAVLDSISMKFNTIISLLNSRALNKSGQCISGKGNEHIFSIINSASHTFSGIFSTTSIQPKNTAIAIELDKDLNIIYNQPADPYTTNIYYSLTPTSDGKVAALGSRTSFNGIEKANLLIIK